MSVGGPPRRLALQLFGIATGFVVFSVLLGSRNPFAPFGVHFSADTRLITLSISLVLAAILGGYFRSVPPLTWWGVMGSMSVVWLVWHLFARQFYDDSLTILVGAVFAVLGTYFSFNTSPTELTIFVWLPVLAGLGLVFVFSIFQGPVGGGWFEGYGTGPIAYGRLMGTGALICLAFAVSRLRGQAIFFAVAFPFLFGAFMLSGSNGVQLSLGLALAAFLFGLRSDREARGRGFMGTGVLAIALFLTAFADYFSSKTSLPGVASLAHGFQVRDSEVIPFYTSGRAAIWRVTVQQFESTHDVLFGTGQAVIKVGDHETHPHNLLMGLALAGGLVALVGLVVLGVFALRTLFQENRTPDSVTQIPFLLFLFWFGSAMLSGDFRDNQLVFLFLAILLGQAQKAKFEARRF